MDQAQRLLGKRHRFFICEKMASEPEPDADLSEFRQLPSPRFLS